MGNGLRRTGVAVFWDVQNCPVPENIEPSLIRQRIEATLKEYGYSGSLTIHAYGKLECHTKEALKIAGIDGINFNRAKDTAEKYMLVDISVLASDIRCPAIYMLISEDLGFSHLVDILNQRGYSCLLCHPNPRVSKLLGTAKHVWGWPQLLLDQKSLPMDEARTSLASDNSISNLSLHPNCYDHQDIGFSIRMILLILCCGICRWLGLMSHPKIFDLLFVMVLYTLILHDIEFIDVFGRTQSVHGGARLFEIARDSHSRSSIEDIKALILICFVEHINIKLGPLVLPSILHLALTVLLLLEYVKCFSRLAGPFIPVVWDFENCRVPRRVNPYSVSRKIRVLLEDHGYFGPVIVRAYGDTNSLAPSDLRALKKEINVIHVNPGNDAADKRIMVDLPFLARADMCAGTFMLISGDSDFVRLVDFLVERGLKFLHCSPKQGARAFHSLANMVCSWPDIVTQKPSQPLLMNAASDSHPSDDSIENFIAFLNSTGQVKVVPFKHPDQDAVFIIFMTVIVLLVGASKHLQLISYPDYLDVAVVLEMWTFMLDCLGVIDFFGFGREYGSMYRVFEDAEFPNCSPTEATWVLSLICVLTCFLEANRWLELWLLPKSVNFLLHCLLLVLIEQRSGFLKFLGWRV